MGFLLQKILRILFHIFKRKIIIINYVFKELQVYYLPNILSSRWRLYNSPQLKSPWTGVTCTQSVVLIIFAAIIYWLLITCQEFYINDFKILTIALRVKYYYSLFLQWFKLRPGKFKLSKNTNLTNKGDNSILSCSLPLIH